MFFYLPCQFWFFSKILRPLTDGFHNKHNKCIYMTQVVFPSAHERPFVLQPNVFDHQIVTRHHVTINSYWLFE